MDKSDATADHARAQATESSQPCGRAADHRPRLSLTRRQRLLAGATAIAVLLSGLNALVQVGKVAVEYCCLASDRK